MRLDEYAGYDGLGLADLVRRGEVSARQLGELALAAVAKVNPRLNAVIETFPDELAQLSATPPAGPFGGVPILVKDFPIAAGIRSEMGSELCRGLALDHDSALMQALRRAGFVNLGRTTARSWEIKIRVRFIDWRSFWNRPRICAWMVTSSAEVTSSAMISRGSRASARAMPTRWRWPPDSWLGWRPRSSGGSSTRLISSATRAGISADGQMRCWRNGSARVRATV